MCRIRDNTLGTTSGQHGYDKLGTTQVQQIGNPHKNVLVTSGTHCVQTFWTLMSIRSFHLWEKNLLVIGGC